MSRKERRSRKQGKQVKEGKRKKEKKEKHGRKATGSGTSNMDLFKECTPLVGPTWVPKG